MGIVLTYLSQWIYGENGKGIYIKNCICMGLLEWELVIGIRAAEAPVDTSTPLISLGRALPYIRN